MSTTDTSTSPAVEGCLLVAEHALDAMAGIVAELGDVAANLTPRLPGANSPYQILTHCLGVCEFWGGAMIAGRVIQRDRDTEFTAAGAVAPLSERARAAKAQLRADITRLCPGQATVATMPEAWDWATDDRALTHDEVLVHIVEELCQHLGHMELSRDVARTA